LQGTLARAFFRAVKSSLLILPRAALVGLVCTKGKIGLGATALPWLDTQRAMINLWSNAFPRPVFCESG